MWITRANKRQLIHVVIRQRFTALSCIYDLIIIVSLFRRCLFELPHWMESRNHVPSKLSLTSWAGLQVEVTPTCCLPYTQYNTSINTTKSSPLPFRHLPSWLWCDAATNCWWALHLSATLCECQSLFVLSVCGIDAVCDNGVWQRTTWSDSQHWCDLILFLPQCHFEVFVWCQPANNAEL